MYLYLLLRDTEVWDIRQYIGPESAWLVIQLYKCLISEHWDLGFKNPSNILQYKLFIASSIISKVFSPS